MNNPKKRVMRSYIYNQTFIAHKALCAGHAYTEASRRSGIPPGCIPYWLKKHGFELPPLRQRKKKGFIPGEKFYTDEQIRWAHQQLESGAKYEPVAKTLGTTRIGLWLLLKRLGFSTPRKGVRRHALEQSLTREVMQSVFDRLVNGEKRKPIARELNISTRALKAFLQKYEFPKIIKKKPTDLWLSRIDKADVIAAHELINNRESKYSIESAKLDITPTNLRQLFVRLNLPLPQIVTPNKKWLSRFKKKDIVIARDNIANGGTIAAEAKRIRTSRQNLKTLLKRLKKLEDLKIVKNIK